MSSDSYPSGSYHGPEINDWVRRAQAGDQEALSQLIQRFSRDVYGKAFSILKNHHDADDVVQETFYVSLKVFQGFDLNRLFEPGSLPLRFANL